MTGRAEKCGECQCPGGGDEPVSLEVGTSSGVGPLNNLRGREGGPGILLHGQRNRGSEVKQPSRLGPQPTSPDSASDHPLAR